MDIDPKRTVKATQQHVFNEDGGADNGIDVEPGVCQRRPPYRGELDERLMFSCPGYSQWGSVRVGHPAAIVLHADAVELPGWAMPERGPNAAGLLPLSVSSCMTTTDDADDYTLDQEPPPNGLPIEAHELWRVASALIVSTGLLGTCGLYVRAMLRHEAKCKLLEIENRRMKDVVG